MKKGKVTAVATVLLLTIVAAIFGVMYLGPHIKLGLDLRGGVQVRLQAQGELQKNDVDKVIEVMNTRINALGVTEPNIQKEGDSRVLIELPGVQDPEEAISIIGRTAQLTFRTYDGEGNENIILDGSQLKTALEAKDNQTGGYVVQVAFDDEGKAVFAQTTKEMVEKFSDLTPEKAFAEGNFQRNIAIYLDDEMISFPFVTQAIPNGEAIITGYNSLESARVLALQLQSGALPVPVEIIEKRTIGPTLGADSIGKSQTAALVGLLLIIIFMIVVYRLPGVVAGFSLIMYSLLLAGALVLLNATLTLPGILGFVLSIGMCIDANIIIYERIKEELTKGKSLKAAIDAGFSRALNTIIDSNVTTLIAAGVLFWLGTGSIRGFAVTLSVGILISMFTAILYTRFLLRGFAQSGFVTDVRYYGGKGE